jgi:TPR repeat protein
MRGDIGEDSRDLDTTRSGCEGGNGKACRHLAGMYSDGRGVGVDEERAREYLRRAARAATSRAAAR